MFVVAADGGWMPQSAEHLAAVDALGVRHGILVVTRADLADPGPATRQALAEIGKTSLGRVEAISVSAVTGQGLDELRAALGRLLAELRAPGTVRSAGHGERRRPGAAVDRPLVHDQGSRHRRHRHAARRNRPQRPGTAAHAVIATGPGPRSAGSRGARRAGRRRRPGGAQPPRRPGRPPGPRDGADRAGPLDTRDRARRPHHPAGGRPAAQAPARAGAPHRGRPQSCPAPDPRHRRPGDLRPAAAPRPAAAARGRPGAAARPRRGRARDLRRDRARPGPAAARPPWRRRGRGQGTVDLASRPDRGRPAPPAQAAAHCSAGVGRPDAAAGRRRGGLAGGPGALVRAAGRAPRRGGRLLRQRPAGSRHADRGGPRGAEAAEPRSGHRAGHRRYRPGRRLPPHFH